MKLVVEIKFINVDLAGLGSLMFRAHSIGRILLDGIRYLTNKLSLKICQFYAENG